MPFTRYSLRATLTIAVLALLAAALGAASAGPAKTPPSNTAAAQTAANYVGESTCLSCHDTKSYKGTAHALTANDKTPASTHGCESCHGAGKDHVDAGGDTSKIVNPSKQSPQKASETCVTCHDRTKHALWAGSQHDQRNVGWPSKPRGATPTIVSVWPLTISPLFSTPGSAPNRDFQ